jgi:hypothetical protein
VTVQAAFDKNSSVFDSDAKAQVEGDCFLLVTPFCGCDDGFFCF